jgi:hypothetical protein
MAYFGHECNKILLVIFCKSLILNLLLDNTFTSVPAAGEKGVGYPPISAKLRNEVVVFACGGLRSGGFGFGSIAG